MTGSGPAPEPALRLRKLWDQHRRAPFPAAGTADPRHQEIALYESWLGSLIEAALANGGRLGPGHLRMLEVRRAEGNQSVWALGGELGEPARSYVARLIALEELLTELPPDR